MGGRKQSNAAELHFQFRSEKCWQQRENRWAGRVPSWMELGSSCLKSERTSDNIRSLLENDDASPKEWFHWSNMLPPIGCSWSWWNALLGVCLAATPARSRRTSPKLWSWMILLGKYYSVPILMKVLLWYWPLRLTYFVGQWYHTTTALSQAGLMSFQSTGNLGPSTIPRPRINNC